MDGRRQQHGQRRGLGKGREPRRRRKKRLNCRGLPSSSQQNDGKAGAPAVLECVYPVTEIPLCLCTFSHVCVSLECVCVELEAFITSNFSEEQNLECNSTRYKKKTTNCRCNDLKCKNCFAKHSGAYLQDWVMLCSFNVVVACESG